GLRALVLRLERFDRGRLLQSQADVVETVEEAVLAEGIELEFYAATVGAADLLLLKIDGDDGVGAALGVVHQLVDLALRQLDRQDAVLEAVVVEDVGEAGRDDAADAENEQRPRRMAAA